MRRGLELWSPSRVQRERELTKFTQDAASKERLPSTHPGLIPGSVK